MCGRFLISISYARRQGLFYVRAASSTVSTSCRKGASAANALEQSEKASFIIVMEEVKIPISSLRGPLFLVPAYAYSVVNDLIDGVIKVST